MENFETISYAYIKGSAEVSLSYSMTAESCE
jgi:hypothetical protein